MMMMTMTMIKVASNGSTNAGISVTKYSRYSSSSSSSSSKRPEADIL